MDYIIYILGFGGKMPSDFRRARDLERKQQTQDKLLDGAATVFVAKGYHQTLISDIAAMAEVGQGTFYRSFSNKRECFAALFDRFIASLVARFDIFSTNTPTNLEEYLSASLSSVKEMAGVLEKNRELALLFIREARAVDREFEARWEEIMGDFADIAATYLDHAIDKGFARSCDSGVVSQCLVGICMRHLEISLSGAQTEAQPEQSIEHLVTEIVGFAFHGFGPRIA
jgi:AcrR family transcriptional regulator